MTTSGRKSYAANPAKDSSCNRVKNLPRKNFYFGSESFAFSVDGNRARQKQQQQIVSTFIFKTALFVSTSDCFRWQQIEFFSETFYIQWNLFVQFYSWRKTHFFASSYFHEISMYQMVLVELSTSFFLGLLSFAKFRWTPIDRILYAQCTNWVILKQVRLNSNLSTHCH